MSDRDTTVNRLPDPDPRHSQDYRRLLWRRRASGLALTEAAARAHCSKSHLSKLEHDQDTASPGLLASLAGVYGCEITDLMQPEPGAADEGPKVAAGPKRRAAA
jgi:transcriptional regulator with XRE-family HTH domain